ncbi:MAG: CusA/CzcA family heavy metal efflux RND transporter [Gammaproteobacteria bacterium]|nr:CusA/CzcA family heavy metal efflux RND transporter [Gammaproteobacteria bacterium]MBT8105950.1 CusA/CzcA family heavy metal efflux RND transporter [Gammaproteobacteria bacterium]NNF49565.1 efflux RND transporter permease subunit [Woeseiaceae bacterium]NNK25964.1 efflux RND transporter permease subunit [Woeseiaceae bacterium]NNL62671.1 efflux RND transporter permease subunit [Woeseiaceae bacterium]
MIAALIRWSVANRVLVLVTALIVTAIGIYSVRQTPVDALPDLSDVQVIVKTSFPGQAPQVVEDQVTYPLTTAMLSVPRAVTVRGYSFFGDSYVYVIFEDGTDLYWARSRVLEYLNQVSSTLPADATSSLGPDATGVGWVFQFALVDRTGQNDLAALRSLQDWFIKYELQTVPGVAEVATIGGMVRQYQVVVDPDKLRAFGVTLAQLKRAIRRGNAETGGSVIEMGEAEYMVRATGYLQGVDDLEDIPLGVNDRGTPLVLSDVAEIRIGPQMRRGIADLDGEGEVVGGVVVMRWGENASATIDAVKARLAELGKSLPDGVEIVTTYDRSDLIRRSVETLESTLVKEFIVVALVCALFLFHLRSSAVIVLSLPLGVLVAFIVMRAQGINANIMSLGGIAIAIGAMVDSAIVMIENVHKRIEKEALTPENRWRVIGDAAVEVGPPLFVSLLIITLSFLPVFTLEAQEGRLFAPLAFTKTYAMAAAAGLSITLVPVLMGYFIRGKVIHEGKNPVNRALVAAYRPVIGAVIRAPRTTLAIAAVILAIGLWPATRLGSEFMPPLDEGDLMYMPTTYPGVSIDKAREMLQHTNRMIKQVPEVRQVFGKIGRAETATDPAPLTMIETVIQLKPRSEWRAGMSPAGLRAELDKAVQYPGLTNAWVMPIKTRIDMLATGIKTPVGIKIAGPDLRVIEDIGRQLEQILDGLPGTASVYSERVAGGRYVDVDIDRERASRFGMNIADIQDIIRSAVGGMNVTQTVEGLERYPVNVRYPQRARDSVQQLRLLPIVTPNGARIALADVANVRVVDGPPVIKSENARPNGWTYIDISDRDLGSYVADARRVVAESLELPAGYSLAWSGQYEYMVRARERLAVVGPITLAVIVLLLFINFGRFAEVAIVMGTLPLALVGGLWLLYLLGYQLSVAVGVGFIALAGVAVEIGVVMLVYLNQAIGRRTVRSRRDVAEAVIEGALLRIRPVIMTVAATIGGLLPIMFSTGTGSEVMRRIAAPMLGGMVSATLLTLAVIPALFQLWRGSGLSHEFGPEGPPT